MWHGNLYSIKGREFHFKWWISLHLQPCLKKNQWFIAHHIISGTCIKCYVSNNGLYSYLFMLFRCWKFRSLTLNLLTSTIVALQHLKAHWAMSVSFPKTCFFFKNLYGLVLEIFRVFENHAQNLTPPPKKKNNNSASWDLQMGFNSASKGLKNKHLYETCGTESVNRPTNHTFVSLQCLYVRVLFISAA
jgi:hypothetical protein